jgi:hypothetical protein
MMADASARPARVNWTSLVTVISAAILIGTEIVGAGLATGWAIATMLGLGEIGAWVLEGLFAIGGFVVIIAFVRAATRIEPIVER